MLGAEPPQVARDLLRSFRVTGTEISEVVWFLIGALSVGLAVWGGSRYRGARRRHALVVPEPREPRRESHRVLAHKPARLILSGYGEALDATLCDVSAGGMSVLVERAIPPGTRLFLRLPLVPGSRQESLRAEVLRCEPSRWSRRIYCHCRFVDLDPARQRSLEHFVAELERAKLSPD